ncbi:CHAT domain-containing protein [Rhodoferax sp.]|uniref:CHAT domain-containing protein n=1 Tax=Rhodoferax sp. TaxID=50421 RepID=UPI0027289305|nr:CHAT domain-containing protein [Rhodoferax sp.]MDO9198235.1 CHAT domain-containing protein [Rhodoferax sp.]
MTGADALDRLVAATLKLFERERLVERFRQQVESLEQGGLEPVVGERALLDEVQKRLAAGFEQLRTLPGSDRESRLSDIEAVLDGEAWESVADLLPDLEKKCQLQAELVQEAGSQLKSWENEVAELARVVDGARQDGAPFGALEEELKAARARLASLRAALTERMYANLRNLRDMAALAITRFAQRVHQAETQVSRVKSLVKQADLLIMQTRIDDDNFEYRVLLRCADRTQTRGINIIQDVLQVTRADRDDLVARVSAITSGINQRLRRDHATRGGTTAVPGAAATDAAALPGSDATDFSTEIKNLGRFMLRTVIPEQMHELLRSQDWSFSVTTNDLALPWELICLDEPEGEDVEEPQFLCLSKSVSRMPLGEVFPTMRRRRRPDAAQGRRMLLIHSDPHGNLPAAADEVQTIADELTALAARSGWPLDIVRLDPSNATNSRLNQVLMEEPSFDFIHFAGHAFFDPATPGQSGLVLKDSVLTADKIRRLSRGGSLVFLNACESGAVARDSDAQQVSYLLRNPDPVVGLASAFVYSGALGCIGSLWPVYDQAAAALAVKFYTYVLAGDPTGEALRRARAEIRREYADVSTWAAYVLYGDPTFRLTEG